MFTDRERTALEFTDLFVRDHESIDDALMKRLEALFDPAEELELAVTVARHMGFGRITRVFRLDHDSCPLPGHATGEPGMP